MKINSNSHVIPISSLSLSAEDKLNLNLPSAMKLDCISRIVKIDNTFYFWKYADIINELIGSYLSSLIGLDSAQYEIGVYNGVNGVTRVLSKLFFEDGFQYYYANGYEKAMPFQTSINRNFRNYLYYFSERLNFLDSQVQSEMLKLIAVDLKMGQLDRHVENIIFKKDKDLHLAPVFDFTNSYSKNPKDFQYYQNPFLFLRMNAISLRKFAQTYPEIMEYVRILREITMEDILAAIEREKNVEFETCEKDYRILLDEKYSRILKKL